MTVSERRVDIRILRGAIASLPMLGLRLPCILRKGVLCELAIPILKPRKAILRPLQPQFFTTLVPHQYGGANLACGSGPWPTYCGIGVH